MRHCQVDVAEALMFVARWLNEIKTARIKLKELFLKSCIFKVFLSFALGFEMVECTFS